MEKTIGYLLLKMILNKINASMIIQNQGLVSKFLKGSYPKLPKTLVSKSSSQVYIVSNNERIFSSVKKFFIASIIYKFYRLFVIL